MSVANLVNELGRSCQRRSRLGCARLAYACASALAPSWSVPWFNRGLIAKFQRRWRDCRAFNKRASELDPDNRASWWNLGIAATALADWETARRAWSSYGIQVPAGTGPLDMELGPIPIRVSPMERPEVVWCRRLDPARAVIHSVPTPECGRGCGDTVLHDGAANGHRLLGGQEVPVFDELELLTPGLLHTFSARVVAPTQADVKELESLSIDGELMVEDWTLSIHWLCKNCNEGTPHEHPGQSESNWQAERTIGVAATSEAAVRSVLTEWVNRGSGRRLDAIECVLHRTEPSSSAGAA